jgi:hypothetical protein
MTRNPWYGLASAAAVASIGVLLSGAPASGHGSRSVTTILGGLQGPRGIAIGPAGRLVFGEASGAISELTRRGAVNEITSVPPTFIAPAVATRGGRVFALTAAGDPATGAGTLYRVTRDRVRALANIIAYQHTDPDPFNLADPPEESNPFGVAPLKDGSVLVADAAANDLLRVFPNGTIITVARLKPRTVPVPAGLPPGFPPAGSMLASEAVATSVTVGPDGYYYVGELRGFPATPGTSQIWRIAPGSVNAVCDPEAPNRGKCRRYADGFTSIVDLEADDKGSIYVIELAKQSWFQFELGLGGPPVGSLIRLRRGGSRTELAAGQLILPGGVAVGDGALYVTTTVLPPLGPGAIVKIDR